jgi:F-type H+-transporting ATPase subunit gamma
LPSTRDIRRRIKSVKNTRQITKAMELVAASKMKRAQQAALAGRPYAELLGQMLLTLTGRETPVVHPFLQAREVRTRGILVVTTDKGLCGPLNANILKLVSEVTGPAKFVVIGRKGSQFLARTRRDLLAEFTVSDKVAFSEVRPVAEFMAKQFVDGVVDTVEVFYPQFVNTLIQQPTAITLLPLSDLAAQAEKLKAHGAKDSGAAAAVADTRDMLFEPDASTVLANLLPLYVNREIYQFNLAAKASEHSARMVAMKTAKDNATTLLGDLTLEYNKVRQASITSEILEIAAGQMATSG